MIGRAAKRAVDFVVALVGLVVLSPLLAVLAVLIKLDSPGPAVFHHERIGRSGRPFRFYKFRTMRIGTDPYDFSPSGETDPRVTRIGRWLRKTSLDELPQLVNVLRGDMSLVGPRPLLPWQYEKWSDRQRRRCAVRPGLTGWAQIHGRAGLTHEEKIELDLWYVDHAGLGLDTKILFRTAWLVLTGKGIWETRYSRAEGGPPSDAPPAS